MNRLLSTLIASLLLISASAAGPVTKWGQLQVKGNQLCDQQGQPVVLRGVSFGWHNIWPRFYNQDAVRTLKKDWKATVVRAAIGTRIEDNYLVNPTFALQCLDNVIKGAIKEDVYVIVDWHSHDLFTEQAKAFFDYVSKKYGHYPNIIYELYNEPVEDSWDDLKVYAQEVMDVIRKNDPDNVILMGCPHWDQDIHLVAASPIQGYTNLMYTLHFYAATHGDYLRQRLADAVRGGLPVFVSESGATEASGDGRIDEQSEQQWIDLMEELKVSWICWSISDKNESCSMLLPRAKSGGPWPNDVIKPYGKIVKNLLRKYNR